MNDVTIIGPGRLGGALALALADARAPLTSVVYRTRETADRLAELLPDRDINFVHLSDVEHLESDVVIIAVSDQCISSVTADISDKVGRETIVLHTSGSLSSSVLGELRNVGCSLGSMHPLLAVSDAATGARRFQKAFFTIEGDDRAIDVATEIVHLLGGTPFRIATDVKALYHAAAVTASGHVTTVIDGAIAMLTACGIDREKARQMLVPLVETAAENLKLQDAADALTGTYARGDVAAVERHIAALETADDPSLGRMYLCIAERSLQLAERRNADAANLQSIRDRISVAKTKFGC